MDDDDDDDIGRKKVAIKVKAKRVRITLYRSRKINWPFYSSVYCFCNDLLWCATKLRSPITSQQSSLKSSEKTKERKKEEVYSSLVVVEVEV